MTDKFPSQLMDKFSLRLPSGMRDAIADRADSNGRSMNSEIISILSDALNGTVPDCDLGSTLLIDSLKKEIVKEILDNFIVLPKS